MTVLVTGATGQLGAPTLTALRAAGHDARGLSRSGNDGTLRADLLTANGVAEAFEGVDTVVHCAQTGGKHDIGMAENLVDACKASSVTRLVLISIVGIERIPLSYYRQRLAIEQVVQDSGVPHAIQRATQFHTLIDALFSGQRYLPFVTAPAARFQTIAVGEVALRLAELADDRAEGLMPDIGGPERLDIRELYRQWRAAASGRRPLLRVRLPGAIFAGLKAGENLVPGEPYGTETFAEYLAARHPLRSDA